MKQPGARLVYIELVPLEPSAYVFYSGGGGDGGGTWREQQYADMFAQLPLSSAAEY